MRSTLGLKNVSSPLSPIYWFAMKFIFDTLTFFNVSLILFVSCHKNEIDLSQLYFEKLSFEKLHFTYLSFSL